MVDRWESEQDRIDAAADHYLAPSAGRQVDQSLTEILAKKIASQLQGTSALELGLGDGVWAPYLLDRFERVVSVEGSAPVLEQAEMSLANHPRRSSWRPHLSLFEDFVPDERFDVVLASYVLEHVGNPQALLRQARLDWLNRGGVVEVVVPNAQSLHRRLAVEMGLAADVAELGATDRAAGHKRVYTIDGLRADVRAAGLEIAAERGYLAKVLPNSLMTHLEYEHLKALVDLGADLPIEFAAVLRLTCTQP